VPAAVTTITPDQNLRHAVDHFKYLTTDLGFTATADNILEDIHRSSRGMAGDLPELKGLERAARARITRDGDAWIVPSQSGNGSITSPWHLGRMPVLANISKLRQQPCRHIHAARNVRERDQGGETVPPVVDKAPKKPTYKQVWPVYNEAQTTTMSRMRTAGRAGNGIIAKGRETSSSRPLSTPRPATTCPTTPWGALPVPR